MSKLKKVVSTKMPNSEEFFRCIMKGHQSVYNKEQRDFIQKAVEFARIHVQTALEIASDSVQTKTDTDYNRNGEIYDYQIIDKQSIIDSYPPNIMVK